MQKLPMYQRMILPIVAALLLLLVSASSVLAATTNVQHPLWLKGPKQHYLALGDSLAFGYQPNGDYTHGYATDFFANLQGHGVQDVVDLGCPGETSSTMIYGGCPYAPQGTPPQLVSAVAYLRAFPGTVSPVTLDIGANDLLKDANYATCTINASQFTTDLHTLNTNLRTIILPALYAALMVKGKQTGDILMMDYYDPTQNICPNLVKYTRLLNWYLGIDLSGYGKLVPVFGAFGGSQTPNPNICTYTWMCSPYHDIHATDLGYAVIAQTFEATAGY